MRLIDKNTAKELMRIGRLTDVLRTRTLHEDLTVSTSFKLPPEASTRTILARLLSNTIACSSSALCFLDLGIWPSIENLVVLRFIRRGLDLDTDLLEYPLTVFEAGEIEACYGLLSAGLYSYLDIALWSNVPEISVVISHDDFIHIAHSNSARAISLISSVAELLKESE